MGKMPPPPPFKELHLHPSTKQLELLPNTNRAPPTQYLVFETAKDSSSSGFFVSGQRVQDTNKNTCRQMFKALEPFRKEVVVDEPSKDTAMAVSIFFNYHKKWNH
jgi:hypothetical protein